MSAVPVTDRDAKRLSTELNRADTAESAASGEPSTEPTARTPETTEQMVTVQKPRRYRRRKPEVGSAPPAVDENPLRAIVDSAKELGIQFKTEPWTFADLMEWAEKTRAARTEAQCRSLDNWIKQMEAQVQAESLYRRTVQAGRETLVRFALAMILVIGAVGGVLAGVLLSLDADQVTQYMAPITGLAGIAVGYFFGRASQSP